jgi:ribosomal protein L7Ae-like RNA K-turn-binding protein
MMTLWMAVTADKYELPIAVADTGLELGRMLGISSSAITHAMKRGYGKRHTQRYLKVELQEEETTL